MMDWMLLNAGDRGRDLSRTQPSADGALRYTSMGKSETILSAYTLLTHSHTMTPFDAPGKQAY